MENWNLQWPLLLFSTTQPTASSPVTRSLYQYMYGYWDFFLFFPCIWFGILELFLKGFCNGLSSSRPNYSWMRGSGNNIRPIKAAVEMPPFPLFEPPQIESDTPSQVCAMPLFSSFRSLFFLQLLFYAMLGFSENFGKMTKFEILCPGFFFVWVLRLPNTTVGLSWRESRIFFLCLFFVFRATKRFVYLFWK